MRLAILGGTFDPVHTGHLYLARTAADALGLDKVLFLPTGHPPHKLCPLATGEQRLEMVRLAIAGDERMEACDIETRREGTTYTIDTLRLLTERYPGAQMHYIIGADTLAVLDQWRSFSEVAKLTQFLVFERSGDDTDVSEQVKRLEATGARITLMAERGPNISSSQARMLAAGENMQLLDCVPEPVAQMIGRMGFYRHAKVREDILAFIRAQLSQGRFTHTLGVEHVATSLAMHHGQDHIAASLAALLHDCAKELPGEEIIRIALEDGYDTDEMERTRPFLLHGRAGAVLALRNFGVVDERILSAIRWHVTGRVGMTRLDMILYIADMIEPGRPFDNTELADLARQDLRRACKLAFAKTIGHIAGKGKLLYPRTVHSYNSLIGEEH